MRRALGFLVIVVLAAAGVVLGLYGLFALLYRDHSGGSADTYYVSNTSVKLGGHTIDAHLVGGVALLIAFVLIVAAVSLLRRERRSAQRS